MMPGRYVQLARGERSARAKELGEGMFESPRGAGHHLTMGGINKGDLGVMLSGSSGRTISRADTLTAGQVIPDV